MDERGGRLQDAAELERIRALAIPPAWENVWICPLPNGHLQAVGTDAAGRRQYLYHPTWRIRRDREKFEAMIAFARALPGLRAESERLLRRRGLPKPRVLAFAVALLDRGLFRVGGEDYAKQNGSRGLTTLQRRHVHLASSDTIEFDYKGKTGKRLVHAVVDRRLQGIARELVERPESGKAFLVFADGGAFVDLHADDINAFIKTVCGGDFSAKDFRTWHATVLAAASLARSDEPTTKAGRNRALTEAAETVAEALGNTPAISKTSYIDPRVFDLYRSGTTISRRSANRLFEQGEHDAAERAVIRLLAKS
ncbi:MAG TPA: hypothetical protein VH538_01300 [Gaiellaceae bacterium]